MFTGEENPWTKEEEAAQMVVMRRLQPKLNQTIVSDCLNQIEVLSLIIDQKIRGRRKKKLHRWWKFATKT